MEKTGGKERSYLSGGCFRMFFDVYCNTGLFIVRLLS